MGGTVAVGATQHFRYVDDPRHKGEVKVKTLQYIYTVSLGGSIDQPLIEWHWHPDKRVEPHVHIPHLPDALASAHLPTGRVAFEEVVRFLISDLEVEVKDDDWDMTLRECQNRFETYRSWPGSNS